MKYDDRGMVWTDGDPEQPGMIYWSGSCDPDVFPKMKLAVWATIKWRIWKWWHSYR